MMRALEDRGVTGWRFAWVGDGHGMGMLRDAIRAEGVEDLVLTPGFAEDVGSAYGAMDRFVLPSLEEAHPLALVEAMLAGVPAIASAVGWAAEHPDLVRLVPRGPSGEDLASALLADLADPGGSADRAERARSYCLRELSPSRFARAWVAVFDRLTGQATPPDASLLILANACPYADRPFPSCSCGDRKCFRMDRIVGVADCLDCVGHLVNG
jgi:glycosyltransferase involved in cell wall biosynthesis